MPVLLRYPQGGFLYSLGTGDTVIYPLMNHAEVAAAAAKVLRLPGDGRDDVAEGPGQSMTWLQRVRSQSDMDAARVRRLERSKDMFSKGEEGRFR